MSLNLPSPLVTTEWLESHLGDEKLRVFDCNVDMNFGRVDGPPVLSGRIAWEKSHISGSGFLDLLLDLSNKDNPIPLMMPSAEQFANVLSAAGVEDGHAVILYDRDANMWAARAWWMLRYFGFDNAAVLSGGWAKWIEEGRPVSGAPSEYPASNFVPSEREQLIADKAEVLSAIDDDSVLLLNALSRTEHSGKASRYGARAGHIPSSHNIPARSLLDDDAVDYLPVEELRKQFEDIDALNQRRVITYCGGGVAACSDALVLTLLGAKDVAVYDGSMLEWAADPECPLTTGADG